MEISGNSRSQDLAKILLGTQDQNKPPVDKKAGSSSNQQDQVQISQVAKDIQRVRGLAKEDDPARTEKVARIQQAVDAGTYSVSGRKVADSLIKDVLIDSVL